MSQTKEGLLASIQNNSVRRDDQESKMYPWFKEPLDKHGEGGCLPGNGIRSDVRANI